MSSPVLPETAETRASSWERTYARTAVAAAFVLSRLRPRLLRSVMNRVVARGRRPDADEVLRWRGLVVSISTFCAGEGCLPRSIATALLARGHGCGVTWCTGMRDRPFVAHAWVEIDGKPIGEISDLRTFHRVLTAYPQYTDTREVS
ncbi:lasso peptide biosynthesis B2 protein [Actinomyces respiraculi]|uniref:lasso peptide biosynthesis B2 protein n=1 Tax=Actinomyces respiraculi TaxID=2744574 RepID=UPI00141F32F1